MNIAKLITSLQQSALANSSALGVMTISKAIEKLKVGDVITVATRANLPTILATNGNLYFVVGDEALYYNVGGQWKGFWTASSTMYSWGVNSYGQLGSGSTAPRSSPGTVVGGITNWSQVSAGYRHSLGITLSGIAYAWGRNIHGSLGDNSTTSRSSPVTVVGGITNWSQVAISNHSLGVTSTGIAYAWGYNASGRLGDNSTTNRSSPVTVVGGITNWSQLAAGGSHSLGVTLSGIAYAWGYNALGRLGDNSTTSRLSPVTVVGGITNWSQLAAGSNHSLGVTSTGIAYAWGYNGNGRLGDNSTTTRSSPVTVVGGITNWSQLAAGGSHSLGRTTAGVAYAWGLNSTTQLGDNSSTNRSSPVTVVGGITNWSQLAAGSNHSVGLTSTGIAYAWGNNYGDGALGDGTKTNRASPVTPIGGITNWSRISAGINATLGVTAFTTFNNQSII